MNEKKEFLTEENYEKGKKTLKKIALIVLIVGILLGGSIITIGIVKSNNAKKASEETIEKVTSAGDSITDNDNKSRTDKEIQADIDTIEEEIDALESEISTLKIEKSKIFNEDKGFSDRYEAKASEIATKTRELTKLETKLSDYEMELTESEFSNDNSVKDAATSIFSFIGSKATTAMYIPYYIIGGTIILISCITSLALYIFAKRREIVAFSTQQVMPVAQEGIDKISPTIGNAAGSIAEGITKGIKEGSKDKENK